jgi:hypothetical protein
MSTTKFEGDLQVVEAALQKFISDRDRGTGADKMTDAQRAQLFEEADEFLMSTYKIRLYDFLALKNESRLFSESIDRSLFEAWKIIYAQLEQTLEQHKIQAHVVDDFTGAATVSVVCEEAHLDTVLAIARGMRSPPGHSFRLFVSTTKCGKFVKEYVSDLAQE